MPDRLTQKEFVDRHRVVPRTHLVEFEDVFRSADRFVEVDEKTTAVCDGVALQPVQLSGALLTALDGAAQAALDAIYEFIAGEDRDT